jgi:hypothetical protein
LAVSRRSLDGDQRTLPLLFNRPHRQAPDTHNIMGDADATRQAQRQPGARTVPRAKRREWPISVNESAAEAAATP